MKPRILVIEDEPLMARAITQQIAELGFELVATTAYGEEALLLAEKLEFDLALVDLHLAGQLDGISTADSLRKRFDRASRIHPKAVHLAGTTSCHRHGSATARCRVNPAPS